MTEAEARASGLPITIGAIAGAPVEERPEAVTVTAAPAPAAPEPAAPAVPEPVAPVVAAVVVSVPEPAPVVVDPAPVVVVPVEPEPRTLEDKIQAAKDLLKSMGIEVHDGSDPAAPLLAPVADPAPLPVPVPAPVGRCAAYRAARAAVLAPVKAWFAAWNLTKCFNRFITGGRTLIVFGITSALGLADALNGIDLSGLLEGVIGTKVKVGDIITLMSIAAILLRLVSSTPVFQRWQSPAPAGNDGLAPGVGSGSVDEPA